MVGVSRSRLNEQGELHGMRLHIPKCSQVLRPGGTGEGGCVGLPFRPYWKALNFNRLRSSPGPNTYFRFPVVPRRDSSCVR
jgi:hypothetical protein